MAEFKVIGWVGDQTTQVTHIIRAENSDEAYLEFKRKVAKEDPEGSLITIFDVYEVKE